MLNELNLENFQGFASIQRVRLAPLTLIFGPNSSGKSSIARSLLLLQQSLGSFTSNNQGLVFRGESIDLASFSNVVHKHDLKNLLSLGLVTPALHGPSTNVRTTSGVRHGDLASRNISEVGYKLTLEEETVTSLKLEFSFPPGEHMPALGRRMASGKVVIELKRQSRGDLTLFQLEGVEILNDMYALAATSRRDPIEADWDFVESIYPSDAVPSHNDWEVGLESLRMRGLFPVMQPGFFGRSEQILSRISEVIEMLFRLNRISISRALDGVSHVKPLREIPERLLIVDETDAFHVRRGVPRSRLSPSHDVVSEWIQRLTNGQYELRTEEFSSKEVGFLGTLRARHLFDTQTKTPVSFKDVGVGLSQVLPIVEALELARRNSGRNSMNPTKTTVIEQPELHLHPRMQADLMDLMVEVVLEPDSEVQIIAETHSENMVLRLQKRIREGKLSREKVAILYADRDAQGNNQITELTLDEDGDFNEAWPLSFADVRVQDLF
jgi:predicted ATPase